MMFLDLRYSIPFNGIESSEFQDVAKICQKLWFFAVFYGRQKDRKAA
jgi:hypothetical protein